LPKPVEPVWGPVELVWFTGFLSALTAFADRVSPFAAPFSDHATSFQASDHLFCSTFSAFAFYKICNFNLCRVSHFFLSR
jgi:hypothetical protein